MKKSPFTSTSDLRYSLFCGALAVAWLSLAVPAVGGPYRDSAHGDASTGVNRSALDGRYAGYATGNCAHCHEAHASLEGGEPAPAEGPAAHTLFADSFNTARTSNPYAETDNFCFYCHGDGAGPQIVNQDYSVAFGGALSGSGPQSIQAAFNQVSYHNLYDISSYLGGDPINSAWFARLGNPCSACHNPHLAKRNWDSGKPGFPLLSAISRPGEHESLWGETELMSAYSAYEAPYAFGDSREPAGVGEIDGGNTPDYAAFCSTCHNETNAIQSTTLSREIRKVNWGSTGLKQDKHGALGRDGTSYLREPYLTAATLKSNFVLSCLDCHEPHGSENIMLLRRRINGEDLEGTIDETDSLGFACKRCHQDDLAAGGGTGQADKWQYVHHLATGAPYAQVDCINCHGTADGSVPVPCGNCHGHGMNDNWAGANQTGRQTF